MALKIEVTVNKKDVDQGINNVSGVLNQGLINFYRLASVEMFADIQNHFRKQKGPKLRWKKLSQSTLNQRRKKGAGAKILQDTGRLKGSIRPRPKKNAAIVQSNIVYGPIHNFGGRAGRKRSVRIPQREFMYLSKKTTTDLTKEIGDLIEKAWSK